jgi:hypothetical protein
LTRRAMMHGVGHARGGASNVDRSGEADQPEQT